MLIGFRRSSPVANWQLEASEKCISSRQQWIIIVARSLSVDLGLRYEYFGPVHDDAKDLANFVPGQGPVIQGVNGPLYQSDRNNFAPRVGFAYQPTGRGDLVLRGSIGVFYDQINMSPFLDFRPPITAAQGIQGNPYGLAPVSTYGIGGSNGFTAGSGGTPQGDTWVAKQYVFPAVQACNDANCTNTPGFNLFSVNQNFVAPYFFNYNLQVEKGIGDKSVFTIGYVGSEGRKLNNVANINEFNAYPNYDPIS